MTNTRSTAMLTVAFTLGLALAAGAQTTAGVRAGASIEPDQFYFGGHVETPDLARQLRFRPNLEVGVGNDLTVVAINLEMAYHFPSQYDWHFYAGGGPALNFIDTARETSSQGGINALVGFAHDQGVFFEFKVGFIDSPQVKIGLGYTFKR